MRWRPVLLVLSIAAIVIASFAGGPAFAHTEVRRSSPSPGEVVVGSVDSVELQFLDPVLPTVDIRVRSIGDSRADATPVTGLGDVAHTDDGLGASVSFDPLATPGTYVVDYEFVAVDGDAQVDAYRFTVEPVAATDDPNGVGMVVFAGFGLGALVAFGVAVRRRAAST